MSHQMTAALSMGLALSLIVVIGIRSVRGEYSSFYRISAICLAVGLNFTTTETVTGDAMSEFGAMVFFFGIFVGAFLVVVDGFSALQTRFKRGTVDSVPPEDSVHSSM